jgi:scyllo-inositol 2-dehydrogenase (NADP+)
MKTIRVGIIGQGRSGKNIHGFHLATDPRFQIVAVADAIEVRRETSAKQYGAEAYADYRKLLKRKDLDLVVNSTFSHLHAPVTRAALRAGHNVLCEKPFARTVAEVDSLIALSQKTGKLLAVFQQSRYAPYFQQVKRVIDSGVLGRIVQISIGFNGHARRWDWQTLQEYNGGNLANTGPHPLDQALVLFGDGDPEVFCRMDRTEATTGDAENHVKLILSGAGHPLIDLEISSCCAYPCFTYQIYGTCGGLKASQREATWRYYDPQQLPKLELHREPIANAEGGPIYCGEKIEWKTGAWPEQPVEGQETAKDYVPLNPDSNMSQALYSMLYRSLTTGAPLEVTPQQVRRQIAVIEKCRRQNPQIYGKARAVSSKR